MRRLRYAKSADENLDSIFRYITHESSSLETGERLVRHLMAQCRKLAELPGELGRLRPELRDHIRSFPTAGYVIFFRYFNDEVEIVNVLHGSRDIVAYFDDETPAEDS